MQIGSQSHYIQIVSLLEVLRDGVQHLQWFYSYLVNH